MENVRCAINHGEKESGVNGFCLLPKSVAFVIDKYASVTSSDRHTVN